MRTLPFLLCCVAALAGLGSMGILVGLDHGLAGAAIERTCGIGNGCAQVAASPWAVLPPRVGPFAELESSVSVASVGLFQFAIVLSHLLLRRRVPRALSCLAVLGSVLYVGISLLELPAWCRYCAVAHGANLAIAALSWRSAGSGAGGSRAGAWGSTLVGAAVAAGFVLFSQPSLGRHLPMFLEARSAVETQGRGAEFDQWLETPAWRGAGAGEFEHHALVFTHPECLACRSFLRFLDLELLPLADGKLFVEHRVVGVGDAGREVARSLEAARVLGRFGEGYATLLSLDPGAEHDPGTFADSLGLDRQRFEAQRLTQAVNARLARDRAAIGGLGVEHVPTVFLDRVQLSQNLAGYKPFWKAALGTPALMSERPGETDGPGRSADRGVADPQTQSR